MLDQFTNEEAEEEEGVSNDPTNGSSNGSSKSNKPRSPRSFTIKHKLEILEDYKSDVSGHGFSKISRGWYKNRDTLVARDSHNREPPFTRRWTQTFFPKLMKLYWSGSDTETQKVLALHTNTYMRIKTKVFALKLGVPNFKVSSGYIKGFCRRNILGSRRQTTSRHLPENADNLAMDFIQQVRDFIKEKNKAQQHS